jgi:hypothetical protein
VILGIKTQPEKMVLAIVSDPVEAIVMGLAKKLHPEKAEAPILLIVTEEPSDFVKVVN